MQNNEENNIPQNSPDDDFDFDPSPHVIPVKPQEKSEPKSPERKSKTRLIAIISTLIIMLSMAVFYFLFIKSKSNGADSQGVELTEAQLVQVDKMMNDIFIGEYVGITNNNEDTTNNGKECHLFVSQLLRGSIDNGGINYTMKGNFKIAETDVYLDHFYIATSTAKASLSDAGKSLSNITMYLKSNNGQQLMMEFENHKSFKGRLELKKSNTYIYCFATKLNDPDYGFVLDNQLIGTWKGQISGQDATLILKPYFMHFSNEKWGLSSDCKILRPDGQGSISFLQGNVNWKKIGDNFIGTMVFKTNEDREIYIYEADVTGTVANGIMRGDIKGRSHKENQKDTLQSIFYFSK